MNKKPRVSDPAHKIESSHPQPSAPTRKVGSGSWAQPAADPARKVGSSHPTQPAAEPAHKAKSGHATRPANSAKHGATQR